MTIKTMIAKYAGRCARTGAPIRPGDEIQYDTATRKHGSRTKMIGHDVLARTCRTCFRSVAVSITKTKMAGVSMRHVVGAAHENNIHS